MKTLQQPAIVLGLLSYAGFGFAQAAPAAPAAAEPPAPAQPAAPAAPAGPVAPAEPAAPAPAPAAESAAPAPAPAAPASQAAEAPTATGEEAGADEDSGFAQIDDGSGALGDTQEGPKLEIYGFADFSYLQLLVPDDSEWLAAYQQHSSFYVGHMNLYLSAQLDQRWRTLMEVRFSYLPNGAEKVDDAGVFQRTDTTFLDYAEFEKPNRWGSVIIERAWIEYSPFDLLTIRAGQWLTPYGFWNEDHGSPTITSVHRPFVIGNQLFPERQTGLEAHGKLYIDDTALGYHLTLSNGRGPIDAYRDLDDNKAVGGSVYLQTPLVGQLDIGVAAYKGRYTDSHKVVSIDNSGAAPTIQTNIVRDVAYDELSLAGELRFQLGDLLLQSEITMNEAAYDDDARAVYQGIDPTFYAIPDYRRWGTYGLVAYRTPWFGLMPYVLGEYYNFAEDPTLQPMTALTAGLNVRPTANVVLKAEFSTVDFEGAGAAGIGDEPIRVFSSQVAWAF